MTIKKKKEVYREPTGQELAGHRFMKEQPSAYEVFMTEQNIPIYRGMGLYDVRQLPLAPWARLGGQGTFIELDGQAGYWGLYAVEVPAGAVLNPERHMYEEIFLIIEGRGSTEVWWEGSAKKQTFEWQPGSNFAIPLNTWHRLVNATSSPALVLAGTAAPIAMGLYQSRSFIFDNPYQFKDRYDESENYFKPRDELESEPVSGRAMFRSSLIPDITHCYLPLDNLRAPGYKRVLPRMANNTFFSGFIAEYPVGFYSHAHCHEGKAVLICLRGKGYTLKWPAEVGPRPWEAGKSHLVIRQDYIPGGMVSVAPGGREWFHQHFGVAKDVFRLRNLGGGGLRRVGQASKEFDRKGTEIRGSRELSYREEDAMIRKMYQEALEKEGGKFQMPEELYQ